VASKPNVDNYVLNVNARLNLGIGNMSDKYQLNLFHTDPKNPPISFTSVNLTNTSKINTCKSTIAKTTIASIHLNGASQYDSWTFNWPIKTMDLTTLTYFWIVLIVVILSKLSTRIIDEKTKNPIAFLSNYDFLWIGIGAIIAVLIFSSYQQLVHLTGNILYNISLAFAFGFGFDKVLQQTTSNLAYLRPKSEG
jgi:hypothetical protein